MCMVRAQTNNTNATTEVQRLNQVNVCHLVGNDLKAGFFFSDLLGGALHGTLGPVAPYLWVSFFFFFFFFFDLFRRCLAWDSRSRCTLPFGVFFFFFFRFIGRCLAWDSRSCCTLPCRFFFFFLFNYLVYSNINLDREFDQ